MLEWKKWQTRKSRAFIIYSKMSRHEMPDKVKRIIVSCWEKHQNINKCRNEKTTDQKKVGHSESTQRQVDSKCPISWKKNIVSCWEKHQVINKCRNEKTTGHKKSRAFRIHSNMSRHKMPNKMFRKTLKCDVSFGLRNFTYHPVRLLLL